jgi:hypothetical protein
LAWINYTSSALSHWAEEDSPGTYLSIGKEKIEIPKIGEITSIDDKKFEEFLTLGKGSLTDRYTLAVTRPACRSIAMVR